MKWLAVALFAALLLLQYRLWLSNDGVAEVLTRLGDARSQRFRMRVPDALARYVARKGSVALDGVSLTVNAVERQEFEVNLVPHTLAETTLGELAVGDRVNLEVDLIARYTERLLAAHQGHQPGSSADDEDPMMKIR